ncbi:MAG: hypothetical protein EA369_07485 [Bradymonadales bacterium]|nr:MAG: hypothetical protein EA369_07485 [Bradymonadales bacterium]
MQELNQYFLQFEAFRAAFVFILFDVIMKEFFYSINLFPFAAPRNPKHFIVLGVNPGENQTTRPVGRARWAVFQA